MKKLIFIDNDGETRAKDDCDSFKSKLEVNSNLDESYISTIEIVHDFHRLSREDAYKILFDKDSCVCSFSMYTVNHYGSYQQLAHFLSAAGRNEVRDMVYIDSSGHMVKALENFFSSSDKINFIPILQAIETNNVLTINYDLPGKALKRVRVDLKGIFESHFRYEDVDLKQLLQ